MSNQYRIASIVLLAIACIGHLFMVVTSESYAEHRIVITIFMQLIALSTAAWFSANFLDDTEE